MATKRVAQSSVNWQKLSDKLTSNHAAELARLKGQNSTYSAQVNQLKSDLPKVDFAALKKQLPTHAATIDALQKQYEALKIPYGDVPTNLSSEVDQWVKFNDARIKLHTLKTTDGAENAKKVEAKWAKAPPVEHMYPEHYAEFFPKLHPDLRYTKRIPDPFELGINDTTILQERFSNYQILRRPDKVDDH